MSKRILVIEDNRDNMTLIVDLLSSLDYEIFQAFDGETGIEMAEKNTPDLILMDLSLPRMDGWTAAKAIKDKPEYNAIPIIALTAHAMSGDKERALAAGCDDYLTKPIEMMQLLKKLTLYLDS
jgi:two-component system cell cycle response regulator DivK